MLWVEETMRLEEDCGTWAAVACCSLTVHAEFFPLPCLRQRVAGTGVVHVCLIMNVMGRATPVRCGVRGRPSF